MHVAEYSIPKRQGKDSSDPPSFVTKCFAPAALDALGQEAMAATRGRGSKMLSVSGSPHCSGNHIL